MLTVSEDDDDLFDAIRAGANGYLLKNIRPEVLFEDLRGVMRGEAPIAPGIAHKLLDALREGPPRPRTAGRARRGRDGAHPSRDGDPPARGGRPLQQGDRRPAGDHRGHGEEPRPQLPREAAPLEPHPGGGIHGGPGPARCRGRWRIPTSAEAPTPYVLRPAPYFRAPRPAPRVGADGAVGPGPTTAAAFLRLAPLDLARPIGPIRSGRQGGRSVPFDRPNGTLIVPSGGW